MATKKIAPAEQRQKRGRWVLPFLLVVTVLLGWYFWTN